MSMFFEKALPKSNSGQGAHSFDRVLRSQFDSFSLLLQDNGIYLEGNSEAAWANFETLPLERQLSISRIFSRYIDVVTDIRSQGIEFRDTVQSLWRIHSSFGWLVNDEVLQEISDSDVVEIYMKDQSPLYRNFNYYKYTSYSISDLAFHTWPELIDHGTGGAPSLDEVGFEIFVKNSTQKKKFVVPSYTATERFSPRRLVAKLTSKSFTALKSATSNLNEAVLVIWDIELLKHPELDRHPEPQIS